MKPIYHYRPETGEYVEPGFADPSPLEDDIWLIPAYATPIAPPETGARQVAVYCDADGQVPPDLQAGSWQLIPDWRGVTLWDTETGAEAVVTRPGQVPADIGATDQPRPSAAHRWRGDGWQLDSELQIQLVARAAAQKLADINAGAGRALVELSAGYPAGEIASWPQQTREAEAVAANPKANVLILSAIAKQRGVSVEELAQRVLAKVAAYGMASGYIIGQRQVLEKAIEAVELTAADALQQLEAIQWPDA